MNWSDIVVGKIYRHQSGNVYQITGLGYEKMEAVRLWPKWDLLDMPNCVTLWFSRNLTEVSPEEAMIYLLQD